MKLRTGLAGLATLLLTARSPAEIKTYFLDADQSTKFVASDQRIYRGDCDPDAATPNAGDDQSYCDDECRCTPGVDCALGSVPIQMICDENSGARAGVHCTGDADCPGGFCHPQNVGETCNNSEGRPNGGACDPSIPFPNDGSCPPGFGTRGSPEPPCNFTEGGIAVIDDSGNGAPTLASLSIASEWDDLLGATGIVGIPGTTVAMHSESTLGPAPNQMGIGSTASVIQWGALIGWTRNGELVCTTTCPGGCKGASGCKALGTVEGTAPPFALKAGAFNTDPWVFTGSGDQFTAPSIEIVSIFGAFGPGTVTESIQIGGRQRQIPLLPLSSLAGLTGGLAYLGARALRRRSAQPSQTRVGPG